MKSFAVFIVVFLFFLYTQTYEIIPKDDADEDETTALNENDRVRKSLPDDQNSNELEDHDRVKRSPDAQPNPRPRYYRYYTYRSSYYTYRYSYRYSYYTYYSYRSYRFYSPTSYRSYSVPSRSSSAFHNEDDNELSVGGIIGICIAIVAITVSLVVYIAIKCCN